MAFTANNVQTSNNNIGEDVEIIYNMVIKLQNQYLDQTK